MMPPAELAGYTDEQLEAFYLGADDSPDTDEWRQVIAAEITAREERARRKPARPAASRGEWQLMAHAQYLTTERECRGNLLSRRGLAAGVDPKTLWQGPLRTAEAYASEELREWWREHGRTDITTWQAQASGERRQWDDRKQAMAMDEMASRVVDHAERGYGTSPADARAENIRRADEARARVDARRAQEAADSDEREIARVIAPASGQRAAAGVVAVRVGSAIVPAKPLIDGDQTLRYIYTFLKHFAHWGSEAELVAATLWVASTHARDDKGYPVGQYCARLAIVGASGSGKSWKSRLIGKLAYSGEILVEPTAPAFIDLCAENHTIVITEADEAFRSPGRSRKIVAVANASYEPDRSSSRKQGGVAVKIRLFCHLVLDGIDEILLSKNRPDLLPLMSRAIIIMSLKAPAGYRPPRFDAKARATAEMLSQRATGWMAQEVADGMADDVPAVPQHLGNRPFALWEELFKVAGRADRALREKARAAGEPDPGQPWTDACTEACEQLESAPGVPDQTEDMGSELDRQMAAYEIREDVLA